MKAKQTSLVSEVTMWLVKYMTCIYVFLFALHFFAVIQQPKPLNVPFECGNIYMLNITRVA